MDAAEVGNGGARLRGAARRLSALGREAGLGLLDLLYPPVCLVCLEPCDSPLCATCRAAFADIAAPMCARCGMPIAGDGEGDPAALCPACRASPPFLFTAARAAGHFSGALRAALLRLKYDGLYTLGAPVGEYMACVLSGSGFAAVRPDLVVPVPLHSSRMRERGFNQSELLARPLARALEVPISERAVRRVRRTRPQFSLHVDERAANVRGAFAVRDPAEVARRCVLVVDDILTTCATVNEVARALSNAGARSVCVAAAARGG